MKKKSYILIGAFILLILSSFVLFLINSQSPSFDDNYISKVHFEGIGTITAESTVEIANKLNSNTSDKTIIMIELDNPYDQSVERPDTNDLTLEEAQAILKKQRNNVKEYYSDSNSEIMKKLGLDKLGIEFTADKYAPFLIGETTRELTQKDIEFIYKLAKENSIVSIYVKNGSSTGDRS